MPAVVVDGKAGIEESHFVFSVARWLLVTTCPDGGPAKLSLAGSAWWRRREMRTGTRDKAVVQPVSLPSSRTETWGKLPGSLARPCARFRALVSWCPGCVGGLGLWPSVPVLSVCPVSSCAPGLIALTGFVSGTCFKKRRRPKATTWQRPGFPILEGDDPRTDLLTGSPFHATWLGGIADGTGRRVIFLAYHISPVPSRSPSFFSSFSSSCLPGRNAARRCLHIAQQQCFMTGFTGINNITLGHRRI